jgi:inhibitor of KinA
VSDVRIIPAGDSALIVEFADVIDAATSDRVIAVARSIRAAKVPGVRDVVPTYRSAAVYFDPLKTDVCELRARLESDCANPVVEAVRERPPIRIPVSYGGRSGPDLDEVAAFAGVDRPVAIALHCGRTYRVFMLGFLPGFAYMGPVDERIAAPRLATPRVRVPAGSVAIAGTQTGIYPVDSPGGWRLIGRTAVKPFDASRADPFLFGPGDRVQFYPMGDTGT